MATIMIAGGCKKDKEPTPTPIPTVSPILTSTEAALVGDWVWDSLTWVNSSSILITNYPSDYGIVGAHMTLNPILFDSTIDSVFAGTYVSGATTYGSWKVVNIGSNEALIHNVSCFTSNCNLPFQNGIITTLTPASLVVYHGTMQDVTFYYHK